MGTVAGRLYVDPMKPITAKAEFEKFVRKSGTTIARLAPENGIRLMLEFYKQIRADNCPIDEDGDMLLYQWGTYNWGEGPYFQCDITRQFIETGFEGDDSISQLSMCFYFCPSEELKELKSGNRWCSSPTELSDFESFIKANATYLRFATADPAKIKVKYSKI
jgi:hypothetical protein